MLQNLQNPPTRIYQNIQKYYSALRQVPILQAAEYMYGADSRHNGITGQSVILECDADSQIWIEADFVDTCHVYGDSTRLSTFGGSLLRQM